jgi:ABC-type transporter Mla maintaining outer membrane lipid asymmetry ATPase subunit MlaF
VHLALEVVDRAYVLSHGRLAMHGTAAQLRTDESLLAASYFGDRSTAEQLVESSGHAREIDMTAPPSP